VTILIYLSLLTVVSTATVFVKAVIAAPDGIEDEGGFAREAQLAPQLVPARNGLVPPPHALVALSPITPAQR